IKGMTREQYAETEELSRQINESLKAAFENGDPSGELAQKVCSMHKKWLGYFWKKYSKEAHLGLAQTYVDDPRFTKYYDENVAEGCAAFFLQAMKIYCK
ncbi:MAG TPA: TipAS antibiotic-recognition domain-containing protein, partial [Clostridia bacterium]|nr:TipAS antibiotic-recognition domain-containing protein [Clostridia bacterium]